MRILRMREKPLACVRWVMSSRRSPQLPKLWVASACMTIFNNTNEVLKLNYFTSQNCDILTKICCVCGRHFSSAPRH